MDVPEASDGTCIAPARRLSRGGLCYRARVSFCLPIARSEGGSLTLLDSGWLSLISALWFLIPLGILLVPTVYFACLLWLDGSTGVWIFLAVSAILLFLMISITTYGVLASRRRRRVVVIHPDGHSVTLLDERLLRKRALHCTVDDLRLTAARLLIHGNTRARCDALLLKTPLFEMILMAASSPRASVRIDEYWRELSTLTTIQTIPGVCTRIVLWSPV
jgi:hypothetical protein